MSDIIRIINKKSPNVCNANIILSHFYKSQENVIEKSVVDTLSYNPDIKIEKTGKEIKESLVPIRVNTEEEKNKHYQNMLAFKKEAGIEPTEKFDYYYNENTRIDTPNIYSYEQKYGKNNSIEQDSMITLPKSEVVFITDVQKEAMNKYNHCARQYVKCLMDIVTIDTLTKNLSDNKKIALTVNQASALGF